VPEPFPEEFRRDVVAVATRRQPRLPGTSRHLRVLPAPLGPPGRDRAGTREGLTLAEEAEIRELKESATGSSSRRTRCCADPC
jgi:hypothetical protein